MVLSESFDNFDIHKAIATLLGICTRGARGIRGWAAVRQWPLHHYRYVQLVLGGFVDYILGSS